MASTPTQGVVQRHGNRVKRTLQPSSLQLAVASTSLQLQIILPYSSTMNGFAILFARSLYKNKPALKERIRGYLQESAQVQEAIERGAVAAKLL